jgi:hypothetical protein
LSHGVASIAASVAAAISAHASGLSSVLAWQTSPHAQIGRPQEMQQSLCGLGSWVGGVSRIEKIHRAGFGVDEVLAGHVKV